MPQERNGIALPVLPQRPNRTSLTLILIIVSLSDVVAFWASRVERIINNQINCNPVLILRSSSSSGQMSLLDHVRTPQPGSFFLAFGHFAGFQIAAQGYNTHSHCKAHLSRPF